MAVGLSQPENILSVAGVRLASCHSGIKASADADDMVLIELGEQSRIAAVFTTNKFCAAPVTVAREHLANTKSIRHLLINSGNANAGTGQQGYLNALQSCLLVSEQSGLEPSSVLPFSTGVIGQNLPMSCFESAIPKLFSKLAENNWMPAAHGIMTTDTLPKAVSRQFENDGKTVTITGISKGSGMIKPDMATMLAYVATDAEIAQQELDACLKQAVNKSFNSISVDGDTSTNDACILIASGESRVKTDQNHQLFMSNLIEVFTLLAQAIVRDGEGATKFVEIQVKQACSQHDARELAYTIAHSPLVKTALFASDANWGRILAAVGRAKIDKLEIEKVDLYLGDVCLINQGLPDEGYTEQKGMQVMSKQDIRITVNLNMGISDATVWTTDLSYDYVKINAEYRS